MVKPQTSDIRMTYEYIRVTYGWHTSDVRMTDEYIGVHTNDILTIYEWHTSDIRITYEIIRMTSEWHTSTYEWYTNDIRINIIILTNIKLDSIGNFYIVVFNIISVKNIVLRGCDWFWLLGCSNLCTFLWNILQLAIDLSYYF